ncbi:C6 transcription factor [Aspergillus luchuensis]|uniref:C6 transcription factor n=1 Tax=Aspergillus kawachii TaxID=1069201 RepID=A0A146FLS1_ASPKA|nr:C6 transcription factor [Aspergillus luchuensis]
MFAMQAGKAEGNTWTLSSAYKQWGSTGREVDSVCMRVSLNLDWQPRASLPTNGRPPPCKACQNTGGCIFDETLDLRRKVAARRTQGELEYYRGLLYSLLETLRSSDEEKARQMLEKIRGNAQLNDLVSVIDAPATDFSDASSEHSKSVGPAEDIPSQHERPVVDAHLRITVERLCDSPLFQVSAGPWTVVTNDDHIVSHLISLYFTWDHPLLQVVDQETCGKCALLPSSFQFAISDHDKIYSDFPEVFAVPDDETSRGQHFYAEAERLWNAEEGRVSLANIQAVALMSRLQTSLHSRKVAELKLPKYKPYPVTALDDDDVMWTPYPRFNQVGLAKHPAYLRFVMTKTIDLTDIVADIPELLFDKGLDMAIGELWIAANKKCVRLQRWLDSLPKDFEADDEQPPQILYL